jgi:hypothetical protein
MEEEYGPFYGAAFRAAWKQEQQLRQAKANVTPPACPGIYALVFDSGHVYIGSTNNLLQRRGKWRARSGWSVKMTRLFWETGSSKFKFKVLASSATISRDELYRLQKQAIERAVASGAKVLNTQHYLRR